MATVTVMVKTDNSEAAAPTPDGADIEAIHTNLEAVQVRAEAMQQQVVNVAAAGIEGVKNVSSAVTNQIDRLLAIVLYGRIVKREAEGSLCRVSAFDVFLIIIHSMPFRFLTHLVIVASILVTACNVRSINEAYLTKHVADTFVHNHFDSSHNTFLDLRRPADVWEWGNNVLWPGLMDNNGPCDDSFAHTLVGVPAGSIASTLKLNRSCTEGWADGSGSFHLETPTPWTVAELAAVMDDVDWTEGIAIRTVRVNETENCLTNSYRPHCRPEFSRDNYFTVTTTGQGGKLATESYGPASYPFKYMTAEQSGLKRAVSSHDISASVEAPKGGYVAAIIPFFSASFLPEQVGKAADIPFDPTATDSPIVTRTNGRTPRYACVRLSPNGDDVVQVCDPNADFNGVSRTTGVVRAAVEAMWNDMKRAHFLDLQTREMVITLNLRSNNMGVTARTSFLIEVSAAGALLPSFNHDSAPSGLVDNGLGGSQNTYAFALTWVWVGLILTVYFCIIEGLEMYAFGILAYIQDGARRLHR